MPDGNPYQAPQTAGKPRRPNWPAIIARAIGGLLILWAVERYFMRGVIAIGMLALAAMLLATGSVHEAFYGPNLRQARRRIKQRFAEQSADGDEVAPPPEDFLRQLEKDDR